MIDLREQINAYAFKYKGNYRLISRAIKNNEPFEKVKSRYNFITIGEKNYPSNLYRLEYPPFILYYEGNLELLSGELAAIVGSRIHSNQAAFLTKSITEILSNRYVIISGMARGIDAIAHSNASKTVGVLGNGLTVEYPSSNKELYSHMRQKQLLISEYPENVSPQKYHFPFRNRVIVALAKILVVPCANERGGTMVSVNEALKLDIPIYTLPYSILDPLARGCNELIEQGANMIIRLEDVWKM